MVRRRHERRPDPVPRPGFVRILLVSDLHYTLPQLDWVVRSAPSFELVVLAGDQLDISSTVSLDAQ
jgi:predicted phosphodiesterase